MAGRRVAVEGAAHVYIDVVSRLSMSSALRTQMKQRKKNNSANQNTVGSRFFCCPATWETALALVTTLCRLMLGSCFSVGLLSNNGPAALRRARGSRAAGERMLVSCTSSRSSSARSCAWPGSGAASAERALELMPSCTAMRKH